MWFHYWCWLKQDFFLRRNSWWETLWETFGALRPWAVIKHRSHGILTAPLLLLATAVTQAFSKKHLVVIYSNIIIILDHLFFLLITQSCSHFFSLASSLTKALRQEKKKVGSLCFFILCGFCNDGVPSHLLKGSATGHDWICHQFHSCCQRTRNPQSRSNRKTLFYLHHLVHCSRNKLIDE